MGESTHSRLACSPMEASSPSMRYTFPCMTYSNWSTLEGASLAGSYSPSSGSPSSRRLVAITIRNLSAGGGWVVVMVSLVWLGGDGMRLGIKWGIKFIRIIRKADGKLEKLSRELRICFRN